MFSGDYESEHKDYHYDLAFLRVPQYHSYTNVED